jgi:glycogen phosphorylase
MKNMTILNIFLVTVTI